MKIKNIWVSTYPRCASFWVFNIIKEILKTKKLNVLPDENFIEHDDNKPKTFEFFNKNLKDNNPKNIFLFKIHRILKSNLPNSKIVTVIRDPREIIISNMRFSESNFKDNIKSIKYYMEMTNIYSNYKRDYILILRYENIIKNPSQTIKQILNFTELEIPNENILNIVKKFNKEENIKIINKNDKKLTDNIMKKIPINKNSIVQYAANKYRFYDLKTGFQSKHISNMSEEDYRKSLSKNEIDEIQLLFKDWLKIHKYPLNY
tara:strand:+ start:597 stop:1379 length:783 start_codon:yes stop_codon:yes gene_type:complete